MVVDVTTLEPQVTWGTNPGMVAPVTAAVPDPASFADPDDQVAVARALQYMGLRPGQPIEEIRIDRVFIGSCTNSRIEDLRAAAAIVDGRTVDPRVKAMVVPGSAQVRQQAQEEGLDRIFLDAGFEWRLAGCSMCLGMNPDILDPGERCASTSNRNFEGRQGRGGRTHLVSPQMAAAAALHGHFVDVRTLASEAVPRVKPISRVEGRVAVLDRPDVDTDQIIPKQFLKRIERTGYGQYAFFDWRFDEDGSERPGFELNQPPFEGARILLAGRNFGCGSSREHAAWALQDYGFDVVIASSFGDIFRSNAGKVGMVIVELPEEQVKELMESVDLDRGSDLVVDLEALTVTTPSGQVLPFAFDESTRYRLLNGLDDIGLTLQHEDAITRLRGSRRRAPR